MSTKLQISLEGKVPGLSEHRLSLGAFGKPLARLLSAVRRIASNIYVEAAGESHGARGGRFARTAKRIDLQVIEIRGGSPTQLTLEVAQTSPPGETAPLFNDLPDYAADRLMDALERESKGLGASILVRRYFQELPPGLIGQRYVLTQSNGNSRSVDVGKMTLAEVPVPLPELHTVEGSVSGVGFVPGRTEVRIHSDGRDLVCLAEEEQVELALKLRGSAINAVFVTGDRNRLLLLWESGSPDPGAQYNAEALFTKWDGLLRKLAQ